MYSALDIANYIVSYYKDHGRTISNLKLQKLLYYVQGECLKQLNCCCFYQDIQAWDHGPVVPEVYYEYNCFWGDPITLIKPCIGIEEQFKEVIKSVLEKYKDTDPWDLVEQTHNEFPWRSVYKDGIKNIIIPVEVIKLFFKTQN